MENTVLHIKWKDSNPTMKLEDFRYRKQVVTHIKEGWVIATMPEDRNIYSSMASARNAIDKVLGGCGENGVATTRRKSIIIVGERGEEE